ncbi:MAG: helix-turn-helix transcriptional regulator [Gammaproteobacteria bacterium]|nr:helix-turn-helix transcriptional regulator [Gammaproteobacteria bacterium]
MHGIIDQLRHTRLAKKLKQSELGHKSGLPQSHISKIEQGKADPRLSTVVDLARLLDQELVLVPRSMLPAIRAMLAGEEL